MLSHRSYPGLFVIGRVPNERNGEGAQRALEKSRYFCAAYFRPDRGRRAIAVLEEAPQSEPDEEQDGKTQADALTVGRVEDGRGGREAPSPVPARQTGRAGFPHPAFRVSSLGGARRASQVLPT